MGIYDVVGKQQIQIKSTPNPYMNLYNIGDKIELPDGIHFGYEGWFVVRKGIILCEGYYDEVWDKWGGQLEINLLDNNNLIVKYLQKWDVPQE
jgi:hypothetical protein